MKVRIKYGRDIIKYGDEIRMLAYTTRLGLLETAYITDPMMFIYCANNHTNWFGDFKRLTKFMKDYLD